MEAEAIRLATAFVAAMPGAGAARCLGASADPFTAGGRGSGCHVVPSSEPVRSAAPARVEDNPWHPPEGRAAGWPGHRPQCPGGAAARRLLGESMGFPGLAAHPRRLVSLRDLDNGDVVQATPRPDRQGDSETACGPRYPPVHEGLTSVSSSVVPGR